MSTDEWRQLVRIAGSISLIAEKISGLPDGICSNCHELMMIVESNLIDIIHDILKIDIEKSALISDISIMIQ